VTEQPPYLITPHIESELPLELLLSEEDIENLPDMEDLEQT
jgi:hypothetical protein